MQFVYGNDEFICLFTFCLICHARCEWETLNKCSFTSLPKVATTVGLNFEWGLPFKQLHRRNCFYQLLQCFEKNLRCRQTFIEKWTEKWQIFYHASCEWAPPSFLSDDSLHPFVHKKRRNKLIPFIHSFVHSWLWIHSEQNKQKKIVHIWGHNELTTDFFTSSNGQIDWN